MSCTDTLLTACLSGPFFVINDVAVIVAWECIVAREDSPDLRKKPVKSRFPPGSVVTGDNPIPHLTRWRSIPGYIVCEWGDRRENMTDVEINTSGVVVSSMMRGSQLSSWSSATFAQALRVA